jgi:predicted nucleotidyltransferase
MMRKSMNEMHGRKSNDVEVIRRFIDRKESRREAERARMFAAAKDDFERLVEHLVREFHPMRVYQWGSLLKPERFNEISDIDIAVEDWDNPETALIAEGALEKLTGFHVDLVELERIHPVHAESIRLTGRLVYERK